ncbi:MAG: hypothetical protein M1824_000260 [Vezdaea acicularis]|nr:MAG: hypothetical protein M1824_000260 [Vezdaea acicularis]
MAALLSDVRTNILMPSHLLRSQQNLMYRQRYKAEVERNPPTVSIKGERFTLGHVDRLKDVVSSRKAYNKFIELAQGHDWDNLPALLEGFNIAKRKLYAHEDRMAKTARLAAAAGRPEIMLECAKIRKTGFNLNHTLVVREVIWGFHLKALKSEWDEATTRKALSNAEHVVFGLGHERITPRQRFIRSGPEMVGVVLELAAALAVKHEDNKDSEGKVLRYAEMLRDNIREFKVPSAIGDKTWRVDNVLLLCSVPFLNGLRLASRILDEESNIGAWVKAEVASTESIVEAARQAVEKVYKDRGGPKPRGLTFYEETLSLYKSDQDK